jgi:hypothetical protein
MTLHDRKSTGMQEKRGIARENETCQVVLGYVEEVCPVVGEVNRLQ